MRSGRGSDESRVSDTEFDESWAMVNFFFILFIFFLGFCSTSAKKGI